MEFWLIIIINYFGIIAIVSSTYFFIWVFSKEKDSFTLKLDGLLVATLIFFSILLGNISSGVSILIAETDTFIKVFIFVLAILISIPCLIIFLGLIKNCLDRMQKKEKTDLEIIGNNTPQV